MPGKVKVRILAGRNLPVMDKSSDTSDAFVEVKLGSTTYKTEVYRRSLNPYWNSEWFRFEIDDEELQDEPLQIRIMDYDTYSANDAIGKVYIDLNPLLQKDSKHVLSGWFPIYDTMHGIRGEINCIVKVALFSDANRYRQSSCGFKFFYCPKIPEGYACQAIFGFVEELVVNHDPEYQWIDKIRTPRASNEARQTLFSKISGEVQRKIDSDLNLNLKKNLFDNESNDAKNDSITAPNTLKLSLENLQLLEYPFLTLKNFPIGFIANIGGIVSARSVKLLDQINNPDDPETRDAWWTELRKEIRSHKKTLGCNAVIGYTETAHINDEICILSACGTAALIKACETNLDASKWNHNGSLNPSSINVLKNASNNPTLLEKSKNCHFCHVPYLENQVPFPTNLALCSVCNKSKVPDFLFMTTEPCEFTPTIGYGTLIQARVCRSKKESKGEACAKEISDSLPFLEYELHRQLLTKLKIKGMNSLFNISIRISFGENMLVAVATGTGAYLAPLKPPTPPKISSGKGILCSKLNEIKALISDSISRNRKLYNLNQRTSSTINTSFQNLSQKNENDWNEDFIHDPESKASKKIDFVSENKETCLLLEVDDTEDADIISLMIDSDIPKGFDICNSEYLPGKEQQFMCNLQLFAQVFRTKLSSIKQFGHQFDWIIQSLFIKFRALIPCCLTDLNFRIDIPEADIIQITVTGTLIGMGPPIRSEMTSISRQRSSTGQSENAENDLIFFMDTVDERRADQCDKSIEKSFVYHVKLCLMMLSVCSKRFNKFSEQSQPKEHCGIELTPLSYIPGATLDPYLGNLDFFFIRESSSIRDYGGLSGFVHNFMTEVFAIVRSHVSSLGGNAMTSFHITQLLLLFNPHKNQAQCLINVAGDVVCAHYINK
ncbi:C2 domain-containing protein [Sarcoptes scabiei]|uniref:C2 domain-containing protein n=1 Tax=Sarcoptes scabiei TaxID=52283 RepID=A0A131ZXK0_SARSC|nr:C2 domain-containing protein [Sarcoptes scabiei]